MTLKTRLALGFGALLVMIAAIAAFGGWSTQRAAADARFIVENAMPSLKLGFEMKQLAQDVRRLQSQHLLFDDAAEKQKLAARIEEFAGKFKADVERYVPMIVDAEDRANLAAVRDSFDAYVALNAAFLALSDSAPGNAAKLESGRTMLFGEMRTAMGKLAESVERLNTFNLSWPMRPLRVPTRPRAAAAPA